MSSTSEWAQRRREDKAAAAEQARRDADADAERALHAETVRAEIAGRRAAGHAAQRDQARVRRRERAATRRAAFGAWLAAHRVDLLIYPLAVASAVMAIPAMADYGVEVYGGPTGAVLPVLSELGMWSFALAVQARRRHLPDAPVWSLQAGVWCFAAVAAGLNVAHGLALGWSSALVMGVVSIAGVIAHQLVVAGPSRTRPPRGTRIERAAGRKLAAARRAALDAAVAEIDADGAACLVIAPGTYRIRRRAFGRARLVPHTTSGLPVHDDAGLGEELAGEITAWLATAPLSSIPVPPADEPVGETGNQDVHDDKPGGHGVATLDRPSPSGEHRGDRKARVTRRPRARSLAQLRTELSAAVAAGEVDPTSAESIRTTLRCAPARARALRDEHTNTTGSTGGDQR